jgi:hypothetical protein
MSWTKNCYLWRQRTFVITNDWWSMRWFSHLQENCKEFLFWLSLPSVALSGHPVWKSIITHWYLTCYTFTVTHFHKMFRKQHKLLQILVFMFVSTFCKCLSCVGWNELALVEKSLCYETAVIIPTQIIHDTACLRGLSASTPRKECLDRWIMGSPR